MFPVMPVFSARPESPVKSVSPVSSVMSVTPMLPVISIDASVSSAAKFMRLVFPVTLVSAVFSVIQCFH